ncbi:hypothetical protein KAR91_37245 [Candidatus Pacearchaeota archaeon]|nr:hypothetical protein [Candidatus Pacearchaeota archaeon]
MELKDKLIAGLLLLFLAASATAAIQRSKAVAVQADLDRRVQEEKIDEPYKKALEKSERKRLKLEADLKEKKAEAETYLASIRERDKEIGRLDSEYKLLAESSPDANATIERYKNADIDSICAEFTAMGIPCESMGG